MHTVLEVVQTIAEVLVHHHTLRDPLVQIGLAIIVGCRIARLCRGRR
jgi:hypothetical protein